MRSALAVLNQTMTPCACYVEKTGFGKAETTKLCNLPLGQLGTLSIMRHTTAALSLLAVGCRLTRLTQHLFVKEPSKGYYIVSTDKIIL